MTYILPKPKKIQIGEGIYRLKYNSKIILDAKCSSTYMHYAKILKAEIQQVTGISLDIVRGDSAQKQIYLTIEEGGKCQEGYELTISDKGVVVKGNGAAGLLYGVQSLRQIIRQNCTALPYIEICDEPNIENRGYYFDCTRGRVPTLESLKKMADTCSLYKINQLQLYIEHTYLFQNESEVWRDNTPLTAEEIMEFDEYCNKLHIDLVPSLASFGHLYTLMQTNSFSHLCELDVDTSEGYSMVRRMWHHTVDVTNKESFRLVTSRIDEYMQLFTSKYFNICADETFDLGKGKSKNVAEKSGVTDIYVEFLGKLCQFVMEKGRIPMFWGDVLVTHPEKAANLPKESVCLNWDYWPDSKEESTRKFVEAGVQHLYVCPGVQGWNHFIPQHKDAYSNISKMCSYAHKYNAEGILTTDWGDCGHIAHPEFSVVGMIYGAAFSWSSEILAEDEINSQISIIEYGDKTGEVVNIFGELASAECVNWWNVVQYYEYCTLGLEELKIDNILRIKDEAMIKEKLSEQETLVSKLYDIISVVRENVKPIIAAYILMAEGQKLITKAACMVELHKNVEEGKIYAEKLEHWLFSYKKLWRSVSKESELHRTEKVFLWYADKIRIEATNK